MIEAVSLIPKSTRIGVQMFGSTSRRSRKARPLAASLGSLDVGSGHDLERRTANDARNPRHVRDRNRDDDEPQLGADSRDENQGEDDRRKCHDNVGRSHEHLVDPVARVAGREADSDAADEAEQRSPNASRITDCAAGKEPREGVPPQVVEPEQMVSARRSAKGTPSTEVVE